MQIVRPRPLLLFLLLLVFSFHALASPQIASASRRHQIQLLENWLLSHRGAESGLPVSHVGDSRFTDWCFTYDAAVVGWALPTIFTIAPVAGRLPDHAMRIGGEER
jgi:hypothetical protein